MHIYVPTYIPSLLVTSFLEGINDLFLLGVQRLSTEHLIFFYSLGLLFYLGFLTFLFSLIRST